MDMTEPWQLPAFWLVVPLHQVPVPAVEKGADIYAENTAARLRANGRFRSADEIKSVFIKSDGDLHGRSPTATCVVCGALRRGVSERGPASPSNSDPYTNPKKIFRRQGPLRGSGLALGLALADASPSTLTPHVRAHTDSFPSE
ncbi:hypothetical protein SKAU_G00335190 [Synaphobranchus kaupii]|uniref:Uncharacterized protein n=1 Tax=Synaphobranchus kaupii TaxID=118154 RepID=A0A9Q1ELY1_SYNKA|nr:hypothetical protein SKAU_G00335190 [Synaphobranchus kaupii]